MGTKRTRPYNANSAGAPSVAEAEILFSDTTQAIVDVPAGAVVTRVWAEVLAAFNAGTTNVLEIGVTGTQGKYLPSGTFTPTVGVKAAAGPFAQETAALTIAAFYTQTGGPATTGRARVFVEYVRTAANG